MANFGDINASLTLGAGQVIRRNTGDTVFEAVTFLTAQSNQSLGFFASSNTA